MQNVVNIKKPRKPKPNRKLGAPAKFVLALMINVGLLAVFYPKLKPLLETTPGASGMLTGIVRVTDGDTIRLGNIKIRIHGIDATLL